MSSSSTISNVRRRTRSPRTAHHCAKLEHIDGERPSRPCRSLREQVLSVQRFEHQGGAVVTVAGALLSADGFRHLLRRLKPHMGYQHDLDDILGDYWYGSGTVPGPYPPPPVSQATPPVVPPPLARPAISPVPQGQTARTSQRPANGAKPRSVPQRPKSTLEDARDVIRLTEQLLRPANSRPRDQAYWDETGRLVVEYMTLQLGTNAIEPYRLGFVWWLQASPWAIRRYRDGDDMQRAELVDWYLRVAR